MIARQRGPTLLAAGGEVQILPPFKACPEDGIPAIITRAELKGWLGEWSSQELVLALYRQVGGSLFHRALTAADVEHIVSVLERAFDRRELLALRVIEARVAQPLAGTHVQDPPTPSEPVIEARQPAVKKTWISIQLIDDTQTPVGGVAYEILRGTVIVAKGTLDARGSAYVDRVPEGEYQVRFPELDASEWSRAS
jgi:hypothetical protein